MDFNFVLCPSYHGATLLAVLLNNHSAITSLGDAVPTKDFIQTFSCGESVVNCGFWNELAEHLGNKNDIYSVLPYLDIGKRTKATALGGLIFGSWIAKPYLGDYLERYISFCQSILKITKKNIFIDGEKIITKVAVLRALLDKKTTIKVLHLTRDPRGFLNSCKKYIPGIPVAKAARMWMNNSWVTRLKSPFLRCEYFKLRHEDLCLNPEKAMSKVFAFYGVQNEKTLKKPEDFLSFHLMGNKMLKQFDGNIRLDLEWKTRLSENEKKEMLALTAPLSTQFGYV
jgi:hypothetical protein